jgi:hypothetical protein
MPLSWVENESVVTTNRCQSNHSDPFCPARRWCRVLPLAHKPPTREAAPIAPQLCGQAGGRSMWCPGTLEFPISQTVQLRWILRASTAEGIIGRSGQRDRAETRWAFLGRQRVSRSVPCDAQERCVLGQPGRWVFRR